MTKLASTLPKGDRNGLDAIARQLINAPAGVHVVIALVDCKKVTTDHDNGDVVPTARIRSIEVIGEQDAGPAQVMMRRALERRTGKVVLPLGMEDDIKAAFGNVDPYTGEILG